MGKTSNFFAKKGLSAFICLAANAFPALALPPSLEQQLAQERQMQDSSRSAPFYLRDNYQSLLLTQAGPAKGTVVMLHGYTAGPWQYAELAGRFHAAGYNAYAPRLPGHGLMRPDGIPTGEKILTAAQRQAYEDYLAEIYAQAEDLGGPLSVVGLSGGGVLALRLAEKYPGIQGVAAMAPFLGPDFQGGIQAHGLLAADSLTFGGLGRLLEGVYYGENTPAVPGDPTPHTQGSVSQIMAIFALGTTLRSSHAPVQFFTTAGDSLAAPSTVGSLYYRLGGSRRNGWYHFRAEEQVPHAMASPKQHTDPRKAQQLHGMIFAFVDSGQRFWSPPPGSSQYRGFVRPATLRPGRPGIGLNP